MESIKDIRCQGDECTKECISYAVAMLRLIDAKEMENILNFLRSICRETLFEFARITDEMETALHLSSSVGLNTFIYMLSCRRDQSVYNVNDDLFVEAQYTLSNCNERLKQHKDVLIDKYGQNFKEIHLKDKEYVTDLSLYSNEESVNSSLSKLFSQITKERVQVNEFMKSYGITFIDKYEAILQHMMDESVRLKESLNAINFLINVTTMGRFICENYCNCDERALEQLLTNQYKDIENEVMHFIVREE